MTPQPDPPVRVPLTARVDADLHAGITEAADALDISTNAALNAALREWLDRRRAEAPRHPDEHSALPLVELRAMSGSNQWRVVVDGYPVPHLTASKVETRSYTGDAFGEATLTLDDRFGTQAMRWDEFWRTAWFLANAIAVASGYSCHGPNATRINPHGPPEEAPEFALWADRGWVLAEASGSGGFTYELNFTFRLPAMDDADQHVHTLREELIRMVDRYGGRDVCTRTVALRPLQAPAPVIPAAPKSVDVAEGAA